MSETFVDRFRRPTDWLIGLCVLVMLALSAGMQSQVLVNHDVGWVLNSSAWLLDGARFGRDIVAANPPLIWWLSLPAAAISRLTAINEVTAFRAFVYAICLWSLWTSYRLTQPLCTTGRRLEHVGAVLALSFALLIVPGAIFGQREHIVFALVLPYALVAAIRMQGHDDFRRSTAISIGIAAGIGFSMKPYFLLVPVLLSLELAATRRTIRGIFVTESMAAAATVFAYIGLLLALAPDYFDYAVPIFRSIYWGFETASTIGLYRMVAPGIWLMILALGLGLLTRSSTSTHLALASIAIAFLISYWLQRKGYEYHAYPVLATAIVLFAFAAAAAIQRVNAEPKDRSLHVRALKTGLVVFVLILCMTPRVQQVANWYAWANVNDGPLGIERIRVINAVQSLVHSPHDCVFAFSTHPYPGFPTMNYVDAKWGARSNSQFAIPAIIRRRLDPGAGQPNDITVAEDYTRRSVLEDFRRCPPRVVMAITLPIQHGLGNLPYNAIDFFSEDPRFASIWTGYEETASVGGVRFFVRRADAASLKSVALTRSTEP